MIKHRKNLKRGRFFDQRGVTLVELMVALVLGLVVSGAALALFMTNKQVYTSSENLDRIQESTRTAFELMARDLREANGNPCSNEIALSNGLNGYNTPGHQWWSDWGEGIKGYTGTDAFADAPFGTNAGNRVAGTPALEVWNAVPTGGVVNAAMSTTGDDVTVSSTTGIATNDILVVCDYNHGAIFQATGVGATKIEHHASGAPGNATGDLPPSVYGPDSANPDRYAYISKLSASRWYVGYNGRLDRDGNRLTSLYRTSLVGTQPGQTDEIVDGVAGMTLEYHVQNGANYVDAPTSWSNVDAVQVGLSLTSRDKVGTDKLTIKRDYAHVVAIRSRAP